MFDLGAAIGEDDFVLLVLDGRQGFQRGRDRRRDAGIRRTGSGCRSCVAGLPARRCQGLRLSLRRLRVGCRLGLEEILVAEKDNQQQRGEADGGAHIATAATTGAGALRL